MHDGASFVDQEFDGITLPPGTVLRDAVFDACVLRGVDLSHCSLSDCRFLDCRFIGCTLTATRVPNTVFNDVQFKDCRVTGVD
jgi:uncharacterized protein YjbI with pentapeptide repeats